MFVFGASAPQWARASSFTMFLGQSQQTDIHSPGGIRTHNLNRRVAADLRLRPRGHWDRPKVRSFVNKLRVEEDRSAEPTVTAIVSSLFNKNRGLWQEITSLHLLIPFIFPHFCGPSVNLLVPNNAAYASTISATFARPCWNFCLGVCYFCVWKNCVL
jgi:hypothetical protein